ncbi:ribosome biogenesis protein YTM1 [Tremella mesenterica]|uniref:Ribosome biogenesis protein YTM1 n=1 Tax=Tremella mesenterica TaxID=5217 RepID=A0A4Q1BE54_TREME|nr:ribosome biogenesis protein YTM1 [Tremella mesenterica]
MQVDTTGQPSSGNVRQLPINLFTRSTKHAIPQSTYLIPGSWRRYQLSELINKVLKQDNEGKQPVPFEFIVEGEVLRGSLEAWIKSRGRDEETVVNVEYMESVLPPKQEGAFEQEDWVSGLSLSRPGLILVSSYLSHLRILPLTGQPLYTLPLPTALGASCCTWISPPSITEDILLAAGGIDRSIHVFSLPSLTPNTSTPSSPPQEIYTLMGHTAPISSLTVSKSSKELISASWDGNLHLYSLPSTLEEIHQIPAEPTNYLPGQKRRKKLGEVRGPVEGLTDGDIGQAGWRRAPDGMMRGHKGRIGGVVYDKGSEGRVWSSGWDGSVRGWEVETGVCVTLRQGPSDKAALCVDQFGGNGVIVTGNMDRTVCLWDTRQGTSLISQTLHTSSPVPSLRTHPTSSYTLSAITYSGQIQIWDIRSPKNALFAVQKSPPKRKVTKNGKVFGERLLAMDWDGEVVVAGGEDGEVGVWRARGE